ncbi:Na(+)/H(+) antiporter subunit B [Vreelandella olivaria]|uniref:Na(+)/H(+) antiporter subunit B n=1 Tax=Vreelandella olivaria TaxID=390919 RepID=UPI00201EF960|nr:DUF4040 domain-containing protein [Halomonas olivaria]
MIASFVLLEGVVALCLGAAALVCLFDRHLLRASCLFVVFALFMALAWLLLGAPWLALVEVVLGVVFTGACFFYALGVFSPGTTYPAYNIDAMNYYDYSRDSCSHGVTRVLLALAWCLMMGGAIRYVMPEMVYSPTEHPLVLASIVIAATAMGAFAFHRHLLRRLLAFNILGSSVFLLLAGMAGTVEGAQALISVGLSIAWLGSLLGALLIRYLLMFDHDASPRPDDGVRGQSQ